ncbi:hypothetical protein CPC08DRAFT_700414 [Agrocybe pediades]|nr:hypothetical protein CPC08DRAFT_700414 [Agrocybe pediades]
MAPQLSLVSASLATVGVESFLYGIFFLLSIFSCYLHILRQSSTSPKQSTPHTPFMYAWTVIFASVTAHWILTWIRLFDAFVNFNGGTMPLAYYADLRRITEVVKTGFLVSTVVTCDAIVVSAPAGTTIYRLWVVWNYNKLIVAFPLCSLAGLLVCGVGITYQFSVFLPGADVFTSVAGKWIASNLSFTICTNVYSTTFIAWRIWQINSSSRNLGVAKLNFVLATIIESATIYTSWAVLFLATYLSKNNIQFFAVDTLPVVAGISFMLIMTRVGLGWAQKASAFPFTSVHGSRQRLEANRSGAVPLSNLGLRGPPVTVAISKTVKRDEEDFPSSDSYGESYLFGK